MKNEKEARDEIERNLLRFVHGVQPIYWADTSPETYPFKDCTNCGHRFCGMEDCQDGGTPSSGDWNIKGTA